jgi:23S rRNA G2069 N7-methylase RlmK/C1962 C5-methylase RlmI
MKTITLFPGREKLALNRHPWVFSGAIARLEGQPSSGDVVAVQTAEGKFVHYARDQSAAAEGERPKPKRRWVMLFGKAHKGKPLRDVEGH